MPIVPERPLNEWEKKNLKPKKRIYLPPADTRDFDTFVPVRETKNAKSGYVRVKKKNFKFSKTKHAANYRLDIIQANKFRQMFRED